MGVGSSTQETVNMSGELAQFVKDKIKDNKIMIFSKSFCPFCKMAKGAFQELGVNYEVLELENHPNCDEIQSILHEMTGARSVPRVFIGGHCIGGGTETKNLFKSGELKKMIEQCG